MIRNLLDTNAVSYIVRKAQVRFSARFESSHLTQSAISVVTEAELLFGLARRPQAHALAASVHGLLRKITVLPWTSDSARVYAEIRADLERAGQPMDDMDMMIAAEALVQNTILVTSDTAFSRIERLRTENWTVL
jgi:tRNA(fMet)-specific endonuclease VapC